MGYLVAFQVVVHQGRFRLQRGEHVGDRVQGRVVHLHQLRRVLGQIAVRGDDAGHRIAVETHLVRGQGAHLHRLEPLDGRGQAQACNPLVQVRAGDHGGHAGGSGGCGHVDGQDPGMGVGAAHEAGVQRPWHRDVVQEASRARSTGGGPLFAARTAPGPKRGFAAHNAPPPAASRIAATMR